jgi:hypothetical protein
VKLTAATPSAPATAVANSAVASKADCRRTEAPPPPEGGTAAVAAAAADLAAPPLLANDASAALSAPPSRATMAAEAIAICGRPPNIGRKGPPRQRRPGASVTSVNSPPKNSASLWSTAAA